ncbi:ABC transporter E family member 2-like isoform X2 [Salvia splendens]|uniref:ABC transporter E family member 2-like isoform X2 n=1 Tax=Salvia splendens TaxID=180675 RepID=UPI001C25142E|nr:ABC transporter E family member 2-like isoform X2 [Salvia splendens]
MKQELAADLELIQIMDRYLENLSGGELQSYVIVAEYDLSVLDYMSDIICCLYGRPGRYGDVTLPFSVREGINIFLSGFVPTESFWFRDESLTLNVAETPPEESETCARHKYPSMTKTLGNFMLKVVEGEYTDSQIIVLLGENGTGKSTFLQMRAGFLKPDSVEGSDVEISDLNVSYKPQRLTSKNEFTVRIMLDFICHDSYMDPRFVSEVMEPLSIQKLMDKELVNLSFWRITEGCLTLCLGKRIVVSKVIKKFIRQRKKTAFIAEHDFIMATYLADRVIVYDGKPSVGCVTNSPQSLMTGMNLFLSHLDFTFSKDPTSLLPRINKLESIEDREHKSSGPHYYMDD